jgi:hypothetical protein
MPCRAFQAGRPQLMAHKELMSLSSIAFSLADALFYLPDCSIRHQASLQPISFSYLAFADVASFSSLALYY